MLTKLEVQNYALIRSLSIEWSAQLNIITGETGAGKSILMGALGLLLGNRADTRVLYNEDEKCIVEGVFLVDGYGLESYFTEYDLEYENPLIIRREIYPRGKSRAFINDCLVNLAVLRGISDRLVDVYAQFESLEINQTDNQFDVLDAIGRSLNVRQEYQLLFDQYRNNQNLLNQKLTAQAESEKEMDYLKFQWEELDALNLDPKRDGMLEQEHETMTHAVDIKESSEKAIGIIEEQILDQFYQISQTLSPLKHKHPKLEGLLQELYRIIDEVKEFSSGIRDISDNLDFDPERAELIEERMTTLFKLFRKHQVDNIDVLIDIQEQLLRQIQTGQKYESDIANLEKSIHEQEQKLLEIATELRRYREKSIAKMEIEMKDLLKQLGMKDASFKVDLGHSKQLNKHGIDEIQFLFSANLGGKLLPIRNAASGGELSRLNLCIKSMIAAKITLPTLIFDEIDTGISGHIAGKMGAMLKKLSNNHQVICITHSPQISALADNHYFVYKKIEKNRTETIIKELTDNERIREIAIMLSTNPPTEGAMANAKELLLR